ncbi:MAG: MFS transporter [Dongiaceae bacterium]
MTAAAIVDAARATTGRLSFGALACAQFLGIFNDNLFKMVVSLLAIDTGIIVGGGSAYLSLTGVLFVLPYLLFSGYAGCLADRFDKRRVLIVTKALEIVLMGAATVALVGGSMTFLLVMLFLIATQATFFSPAKYAILPEIVARNDLARANGWLESSRYFAIILGTVAGGILLTVFQDRPTPIGIALLVAAVVGWSSSLLIGRPLPNARREVMPLTPWHGLWKGFGQISRCPVLFVAVGGLLVFDFLSTLVVLDIMLLGKTVMAASDLQIGQLGAGMAVGAGVGCIAAGRLAGSRSPLGTALVGFVGVGLVLVLYSAAASSIGGAMLFAVPLGFFGGFVIVPLNATIQRRAVAMERGRIIASANFLSMLGCLMASGSLWVLHDLLGVSTQGVLVIGGIAAISVALAGYRRAVAVQFGLSVGDGV